MPFTATQLLHSTPTLIASFSILPPLYILPCEHTTTASPDIPTHPTINNFIIQILWGFLLKEYLILTQNPKYIFIISMLYIPAPIQIWYCVNTITASSDMLTHHTKLQGKICILIIQIRLPRTNLMWFFYKCVQGYNPKHETYYYYY